MRTVTWAAFPGVQQLAQQRFSLFAGHPQHLEQVHVLTKILFGDHSAHYVLAVIDGRRVRCRRVSGNISASTGNQVIAK